jgi:hypothetical protein
MTVAELLAELAARGVVIKRAGDLLNIDAPRGTLQENDLAMLRERKADVMRWLRLAEGLPVDRRATELLGCAEIDPEAVPSCLVCGLLCDTQTMTDVWRCSRCDRRAAERRLRTVRLWAHAARLK